MSIEPALRRLLPIVFAILFSSPAWAVNLNVEPQDYTGTWRIAGVTADRSGAEAVDLPPGAYNMVVGNFGNINFQIDAAGTVVSSNPHAATGGNGVLTFQTTTVTVDPGTFEIQTSGNPQVRWRIQRVVGDNIGVNDVVLVKNVPYVFTAGTFGNFTVTLDAAGAMSVNNGVSASVSGSTLTFNTVPVTIDPAGFQLQTIGTPSPRWGVSRVTSEITTPATLNLVPGVRYSVVIGTWGQMFIHLDDVGNVSVDNGVSGVGGYRSLTFNTTPVNIDPANYLDQVDGGTTAVWGVGRVTGFVRNAGTVNLVPGVRFGVTVGSFGAFFFNVDAAGDVTIENGISATADGNSITFLTESVRVEPGAYADNWGITSVVASSGPQNVYLVPGTRYRLTTNAGPAFFNVTSPCAVSPNTLNFSFGDIELSCGLADSDDDGVPDLNDNCPTTANADQLDLDLDGAGDVCDSDIDGDGVGNGADNCPQFANPGQSDLDGDGLGDDCDADTDGDSVADDLDNCPLEPNPGQGNGDGDAEGDACDLDDDNDQVPDAGDNCPTVFNPGQGDFDGNGQGDACDGDVDGDAVDNTDDACPLTPADLPVTGEGCSGAQYVELTCARDNFVQHGRYVSCVAHTAKALSDLGIIDNKDRSTFVKQAAKNK